MVIYKNNITIIIGLIIIIGVIFYVTRRRKEAIEATQNAAEACREISSKADEIEAAMGGIAKIGQAFMGWLQPKNLGSGDNETDNMARNIISTTMTSEDITKISTSCENASSTVQSNIIDNTACEFCQKNGCDISNVSQTNVSTGKQICGINTAIDLLLKKKSSVDAVALGQVLQKTQDAMSGSNKATNKNCNVIDNKLESKAYTENISKCSNVYNLDQSNYLANCGSVTNVIQKNVSEQFQKCMLENKIVSESLMDAEEKVAATGKADQTAVGISPFISLGASLSCCIISVALIAASYMFSQSESGKELISKAGAK